MKKGKAAKKDVITLLTADAVGGLSVGGDYGIPHAPQTSLKLNPLSE